MAGGQIEASSVLDYVIIAAKVRCLGTVTESSRCNANFSLLCFRQLLFAVSPLIVLGYILLSAFEPEELEKKKRSTKVDFNPEGHAE